MCVCVCGYICNPTFPNRSSVSSPRSYGGGSPYDSRREADLAFVGCQYLRFPLASFAKAVQERRSSRGGLGENRYNYKRERSRWLPIETARLVWCTVYIRPFVVMQVPPTPLARG